MGPESGGGIAQHESGIVPQSSDFDEERCHRNGGAVGVPAAVVPMFFQTKVWKADSPPDLGSICSPSLPEGAQWTWLDTCAQKCMLGSRGRESGTSVRSCRGQMSANPMQYRNSMELALGRKSVSFASLATAEPSFDTRRP